MRLKNFAAALLAALTLCGCAMSRQQAQTLRYDLSGAPDALDPQYADSQSELTVISNSFEGLTAVSETGEVVPAAAERWEISPDGRKYTFFLRSDAKWANGDPVTAEDFAFGLRRLFNPEAFSPAAESFLMIKNARRILHDGASPQSLGVGAKSGRELVIELEYDDPSILTALSRASASPCQQEFFEAQKGRYGLEAGKLLCNGPFMVKSWGESVIVLSPNPQYRESVAIEGVNMYINRGDSLQRFIEGRTDLCLVPFYRLSEAGELDGETFYDQSWVMLLNFQNETLASKEVRGALIASAAGSERLKSLPGYLRGYSGIIAPNAMMGGSLYRELAPAPPAAALPDNPRAAFLSALDGMGKTGAGKLTLLVSGFEPGPQLGGDFQRIWQQQLSAFINMEQLEYQPLLERISSGSFDMAIAPLISRSSSPIDCLALFEALPGEDAERLRELLSLARQQTEAEEAAGLLLAAEQYLIDEYIVLPLFAAPSLFVLGEGVSGVYYNSVNHTVYFADAVCLRD